MKVSLDRFCSFITDEQYMSLSKMLMAQKIMMLFVYGITVPLTVCFAVSWLVLTRNGENLDEKTF